MSSRRDINELPRTAGGALPAPRLRRLLRLRARCRRPDDDDRLAFLARLLRASSTRAGFATPEPPARSALVEARRVGARGEPCTCRCARCARRRGLDPPRVDAAASRSGSPRRTCASGSCSTCCTAHRRGAADARAARDVGRGRRRARRAAAPPRRGPARQAAERRRRRGPLGRSAPPASGTRCATRAGSASRSGAATARAPSSIPSSASSCSPTSVADALRACRALLATTSRDRDRARPARPSGRRTALGALAARSAAGVLELREPVAERASPARSRRCCTRCPWSSSTWRPARRPTSRACAGTLGAARRRRAAARAAASAPRAR